MIRNVIPAAFAAIAFFSASAAAQDGNVPYWASISAEEAFMRVGAGQQFPIEWVYTRSGLPVKVVRRHQGWRLVQEPDGTQGWIYSTMLSERRTAIVTGEGLAAMRESGSDEAGLRWNIEPGVTGELGQCVANWCELNVDGHRGWVEQDRLWGAGEP